MSKLIIVINGKGGAGKDTLIELAANEFNITNISSITPIKEAATILGWKGQKDEPSRKFLADIKALSTNYNNYPTKYLVEQCKEFINNSLEDDMIHIREEEKLAFIHIREGNEIDKFKRQLGLPCVTLLIKRPEKEGLIYGNSSDDGVENYKYDYTFDNNEPLDTIGSKFICLLYEILQKNKNDYVETINNNCYLHRCECPKCGHKIYHSGKDRVFYCDNCGTKLHHKPFSEEEIREALFDHEMDEYEDS